MPRYVDADEVKKAIEESWDGCLGAYDSHEITMNDLWVIDKVQTADVVEVVRCKDCVHHINAPKTTGVWCERVDGLLQINWFCADGERREDVEETD